MPERRSWILQSRDAAGRRTGRQFREHRARASLVHLATPPRHGLGHDRYRVVGARSLLRILMLPTRPYEPFSTISSEPSERRPSCWRPDRRRRHRRCGSRRIAQFPPLRGGTAADTPYLLLGTRRHRSFVATVLPHLVVTDKLGEQRTNPSDHERLDFFRIRDESWLRAQLVYRHVHSS